MTDDATMKTFMAGQRGTCAQTDGGTPTPDVTSARSRLAHTEPERRFLQRRIAELGA